MRSVEEAFQPLLKREDGPAEAARPDATDARADQVDRIMREVDACEKLGDAELARRTGRTLLAVVACATDALLADGGKALQSAPDKFGAFFDKAACGYVHAIDGLAKRAALADAAAAANGTAHARPRAEDPLARSIVAWGRAARE
jgi:hypothetical protein